MDMNILIAQFCMQIYDQFLLFSSEIPSLDIGPQIVHPPETAALSTPQQSWNEQSQSPLVKTVFEKEFTLSEKR